VNVSLAACLVSFGLAAGSLIVGLTGAGLLTQLKESDGLARYPGSVRLSESELRLDSLPNGVVRQSVIYHTADHWTQVLIWYVRYLKVDLDQRPRLTGDCFQFADSNAGLIIQERIGITLCSRTAGTTIFVNHQLVLPWWALSLPTWPQWKIVGVLTWRL
jgi:hypothetical protein